MWSDWVSNPGPLALESDALLTTPRDPAELLRESRTVEKVTLPSSSGFTDILLHYLYS